MTDWEDKEAMDNEWRQFKYMAIAAHPENTQSILAALEEAHEAAVQESLPEEEQSPEWAKPITDEELENWVPFSADAEQIIDELRRSGFVVTDDQL